MELKTSNKLYVNGSDGVHFLKLADGNYWMIENLRLDPAGKTLNNTNTNNPTSDFSATVANLSSSSFLTSCSGVYPPYNPNNCNKEFSVGLGNLTGSTSSPTLDNQSVRWYGYGAMYNWHTATAGNGTYETNTGSAAGDICPAGWRLPTGGTGKEFDTLKTAIGTVGGWRTYPVNIVYSGDYNRTTSSNRNVNARLWSANPTSKTDTIRFGLDRLEATTNKSYKKWDAFAVRCIVKNNT